MARTAETLGQFKEADSIFAEIGEWTARVLTLEEVQRIIVPGHHHTPEGGDILIPPEGLVLQEAIDQIYAIAGYTRRNWECMSDLYKSANLDNPVYLSTTIPDTADYERVKPLEGYYYFLGGDLHELIGRGHMYGFHDSNYDSRPIVAYVSC